MNTKTLFAVGSCAMLAIGLGMVRAEDASKEEPNVVHKGVTVIKGSISDGEENNGIVLVLGKGQCVSGQAAGVLESECETGGADGECKIVTGKVTVAGDGHAVVTKLEIPLGKILNELKTQGVTDEKVLAKVKSAVEAVIAREQLEPQKEEVAPQKK